MVVEKYMKLISESDCVSLCLYQEICFVHLILTFIDLILCVCVHVRTDSLIEIEATYKGIALVG